MYHSTLLSDRLAQQQQLELARTLELRRRIAERRDAVKLETSAPAPTPLRAPRWHGLLIRAHLVHPLTH